jgi:cytochrome P450 family 6
MVLLGLFIFAVVCFAVYFFFKRKYAFWKELCVPYVKAKPPFGNLKGLGRKHHFGELLKTHYDALKAKSKRFGFGGIYSFISPTVLVTDLDFVRRVLVDDFEYFQNRGLHLNETDDPLSANLMTLDGDKWKALCKVLIPKFEPTGLEAVLPKMLQVAWNLSKVLGKHAGKEIEICDTFERLTVDMTAACAFKTKCNSLTDPKVLFRRMVEKSILTPRLPLIGQIFMLEYPRIADVLQTIYIPSMVSNFFMSLMDSKKDRKKVKASTAEAFAFFSAGFETSTSALSFTLYELAANAELQEKARQSVMGALTSNGKLCWSSLREMSYLEQCINGEILKTPFLNDILMIFVCSRNSSEIPAHDIFDASRLQRLHRTRHNDHVEPRNARHCASVWNPP